MKERAKRAQQYIVVVLCFPLFFLVQRDVVTVFLSGLSWDENVYVFVDGVFSLVEEVRLTRQITSLFFLEIVSRWLALSFISQLLPSLSAIFFYFIVTGFIWKPLAMVLSIVLGVLLYVFGWKYPSKRLRHVERIFYFEKVRER